MKVHFIAIGGSAMHNLAIALHQKGYEVSGSDDEVFEPSRSRLDSRGLLPKSMGWYPENITTDLDYIILGMHARKDNPELAKANELGIKVLSYPEFIFEQSKDKTRVVIAGSHGKTTISAMILHVLHYHNHQCDFMIGAQLEGFDAMVRLTNDSDFILLEGDEYLSSPIDLRPKFLHYKPNITLISGIAWDHVNVFTTYDDYVKQFDLLLESIEPGGVVIYNQTDTEVDNVIERTKNEVKKFAYGLPDYEVNDGHAVLNTEEGPVPLSIFGKHNMNNLEGARWICNQMGINDEQFYEAITSFKGAARRLETIDASEGIKAFRDFAHAPSKVNATVNAVKESFPNRRVIACLELHTFSSLNIEFMDQYAESMDAADVKYVYFNPEVVAHKRLPELNTQAIQDKFGNSQLEVFDDNTNLISKIKTELKKDDVLLIMSSGSFDGIDWKKVIEEADI
ncbi:UDP-N-acetylmuramate-alanine ligase [Owenweeksia hongkongensis DSM 17368]|uniref:UDP-N-acetylmuramate-alanine ligase n=1 Tax=Owenweeksia hongkongensis (strain DSM 17368 / CIP 108786 / JCM 12287 / NRRL B-23963 / UST20020801) TaxID=926562 RepID=G8QZ60_OWEHD|nr:Mur ligase family protein [Owenweeksia hongkongensis]AEV31443.1 UDP-N-acetylmuramate-alanine ligase [Owenweeksia hongkongensis DSM 17368]